jgi:hypothetical protein
MSDKRIFKLYHEAQFPFTDGGLLDIRVKRMSVGESQAFERRYDAVKSRESLRRTSIRLPGPEMEKQPIARPRTTHEQALADAIDQFDGLTGVPESVTAAMSTILNLARVLVAEPTDAEEFVINDAEVRRRRLEEMPPSVKADYDSLVLQEDAAESAFIEDIVRAFVTLASDQVVIVDADGVETSLTSGDDILRIFGANLGDMRALVQQVYFENRLSDARKKTLRSLFASDVSSAAPAKDPAGNAPEATVVPADEKASASSVDAMALPEISTTE